MPSMMRPKSKATEIAYNILGVPENMSDQKEMQYYRKKRKSYLKEQRTMRYTTTDSSYDSLTIGY